jgi:hypothetical protein
MLKIQMIQTLKVLLGTLYLVFKDRISDFLLVQIFHNLTI